MIVCHILCSVRCPWVVERRPQIQFIIIIYVSTATDRCSLQCVMRTFLMNCQGNMNFFIRSQQREALHTILLNRDKKSTTLQLDFLRQYYIYEIYISVIS